MRDAIMQMLEFPRALARSNVELDQCPHAGHYARGDFHCKACRSLLECEWLHHSDEFSALSKRPLDDVVEALNVACMYVDAQVTISGHLRETCRCDACRWVRQAESTLQSCQDRS